MAKRNPVSKTNYWFIIACVAIALLAVVAFSSWKNYQAQTSYKADSDYRAGNLYGQAIPTKKPIIVQQCSDGTLVGKCSANKPYFCNSQKQKVADSVRCGCPGGQIPVTGGGCSAVAPYEMKTYIEDDLDYQLDRVRYTTGGSRFYTQDSSFWPGVGPKYLTADSAAALALPNNGILYTDPSISFNEVQHAMLFAYTHYDTTSKAVQAQYAKTGYEAVFQPGLPLCLDTTKSVANCPSSSLLKNSNVKIWLLGSSWYVRDVQLSNYNITNMTLVREDGKTLKLSENKEIEVIGQSGSAKNWRVKFISSLYPNSYVTESVYAIRIYNDIDQVYKTPITQTLNPGEAILIIKYPAGYRLNYLGMESTDYDSLQFSVQRVQTFTNTTGGTVTGNFMYILSGKSNAFQYNGVSRPDVYVLLEPFQSWHKVNSVWYLDNNGYLAKAGASVVGQVVYHYKSDEQAFIFINSTNSTGGFLGQLNWTIIQIPEITEDGGGTSAYPTTNWHINFVYDKNLDQLVNSPQAPVSDKVGYSFGGNIYLGTQEPGFVTNRGTIFQAFSPTSASFGYPLNVVHARYTLQYYGDDIVWVPGGYVNQK
ncbi:MAG: hypothetical protein AABX01_00980 [Candidatus Micrarchaeota archaeon]